MEGKTEKCNRGRVHNSKKMQLSTEQTQQSDYCLHLVCITLITNSNLPLFKDQSGCEYIVCVLCCANGVYTHIRNVN